MARPCFLLALLEGFQLIGIYYQIDIQWHLYYILEIKPCGFESRIRDVCS